MKLSTKSTFIIIFVAVALLVGLASAVVVTYVLTASAPQQTDVTQVIQTVNIPVGLSVPTTVTELQTITLIASITDENGNGKIVTFREGSTVLGTRTFVNLQASLTVGPLSVGTHTFTAGP
jgi:hypothetical protein